MAGVDEEHEHHQQEQGKCLHLALLPLPYQGHITPMLQLAYLLHSKGFSITIIHPHYNSPNPSNHPNFRFEIIPDGFVGRPHIEFDFVERLWALNSSCKGPIRDCLVGLQRENPLNTVSCLITDSLLYSTHAVAEELGIPMIVLRTSSPLSFLAYALFPLLKEKGYLSIQDHQSELLIPELPPLRVKDVPTTPNTGVDATSRLIEQVVDATRCATALILNSSEHLEQTILPDLRREFPIPTFLVGPLCKSYYGSSSSTSLFEQDQSCLDWLDKHEPQSILYVSFGSLAKLGEAELVEIAWGLANSEQPFLWVVRPGLVTGSKEAWPYLPDGFFEKDKGKGLVVKWAPQQEVLAHPSVGGFWTHSGWNSTLESICNGVPMICWPHFGDQKTNARLVSCSWRLGLRLEGDRLERGEIEKVVRKLMVDKEGVEMRERIKGFKDNADICVRKGGSSYESTNKLVNHILSL